MMVGLQLLKFIRRTKNLLSHWPTPLYFPPMGSRFWSTSRLFIWRRFVWSWPNSREGRILAAACLLSLSRFVCSWPNAREGRILAAACLLSLSRYVWSWPKAREGRFLAAACIYLLVDLNINGQTLATVDIQRLMALTFAVVLCRGGQTSATSDI